MSTNICDQIDKHRWGSMGKLKIECRKKTECMFSNRDKQCRQIIITEHL